jgi:hypothetical protein
MVVESRWSISGGSASLENLIVMTTLREPSSDDFSKNKIEQFKLAQLRCKISLHAIR